MKKTILITGSTDGIGLATAKSLLKLGHTVLIHGRNAEKLLALEKQLAELAHPRQIFTYQADLSVLSEVEKLVSAIKKEHIVIDCLINNAGVFVVPETVSKDGLDVRFMVNSIAPFLLTQQLLPLLNHDSRVINLSSAAQAPVDPEELTQVSQLSDNTVYAKSKLALTMWSHYMASIVGDNGPVIVAVNPKSFLGSKMVEQAYGVKGNSLQIGADILVRAALSDEFEHASGLYFDNDIGHFTAPHQDALNENKTKGIYEVLNSLMQ